VAGVMIANGAEANRGVARNANSTPRPAAGVRRR
jgi:hypothetical protein